MNDLVIVFKNRVDLLSQLQDIFKELKGLELMWKRVTCRINALDYYTLVYKYSNDFVPIDIRIESPNKELFNRKCVIQRMFSAYYIVDQQYKCVVQADWTVKEKEKTK